jgi:hypothetical protein
VAYSHPKWPGGDLLGVHPKWPPKASFFVLFFFFFLNFNFFF